MPKLFIPNVHEMYKSGNNALTPTDAIARQFYNSRFLWLLNPGDIIILPELPSKDFLSYLANLKRVDMDSLTRIPWKNEFNVSFSDAL